MRIVAENGWYTNGYKMCLSDDSTLVYMRETTVPQHCRVALDGLEGACSIHIRVVCPEDGFIRLLDLLPGSNDVAYWARANGTLVTSERRI